MNFAKLISPLCLLLAMLLMIAAFVIFVSDPPAESVHLHQARVEGSESLENALNDRLLGQIWVRRLLLAGLFCGSIVMTLVAFFSMRGRS